MDVSQKAFSQFLEIPNAKFIIPVYQRNYAWQPKPHCQQLLDDVKAAGKQDADPHFVGSIVYVGEGTASAQRLIIIDGQQRVTTVSILYLAVANALLDQNERRKILKRFLINEDNAEEERLKLRLTNHNDAYRRLINNPGDQHVDFSRVVDNYRFFAKQVNADNAQEIIDGLNNLKIVEIRLLPPQDDPQKIFESMNSTGLGLNAADLIRNYILMNLSYNEQSRIYGDYWRVIENSARLCDTNDERVAEFVRDYLTFEHHELPATKQVYRFFKGKYANISPGQNAVSPEMEQTLGEMRDFSGYFQKILNPQKESDAQIRWHLENIRTLKVGVCRPFLLGVYRDYADSKIDSSTFIGVLELIQSYVWRRSIVGLSASGMNKTFMSLYRDIENVAPENYLAAVGRALTKRSGKQRFPQDDEVFAELKTADVYNIDSDSRKYFLGRLQNDGEAEPIDIWGINSEITIEHIFPQKPNSSWQIPEGEREEMSKRLHTIANLALSGNNGSLGNKSFQEKCDMDKDGGRQGYRFSNLSLTRELATKYEKWGIDEMNDRLHFFQARFVQIWRRPNAQAGANDLEEIDISEMDENGDHRIVAYTFLGERREFDTAVNMYADIVQKLFDLDRQAFINGQLGAIIDLQTSPRNFPNWLINYRQLAAGFWFATHSSTSQKIKNLRKLLGALELTDELQLTLANN